MEKNNDKNNILISKYPFPKYLNTLENFNFIHYKEIIIPRINLNYNFSPNKDKLDTSSIFTYNSNENNKESNIYILIKNEDEINDIKDINNINNNNDMNDKIKIIQNDDKNFFLNENSVENNLNILLKEKIDIEPIPPKIFKSIINDNKSILENKDNSNYKFINLIDNEINKIISNNINLIDNEINKNISKENNIILLLTNNHNNSNKIIPPLPTIIPKEKIKKPIFTTTFKKNWLNPKRKKYLKKVFELGLPLNKRVHLASDNDNILRKIQVHFLSFMVNYINDVIKTLIDDRNVPLFKNLDYKIKKRVKHEYIEDLRNKSIAEILQSKVSPKMKVHDDSVNKNIYSTICKMSPFMVEYLNQGYVSLFKEYYFNENRIFKVDGKIINLSIKTKTFNDLILKNIEYKKKLKYIAINYFLNSYKRTRKPNFMTYIQK